jgi:hypothetical protein
MTRRKSGRNIGIDFGRAAGREAETNESDGVLGTEAGKFHDGEINSAHRNTVTNDNVM